MNNYNSYLVRQWLLPDEQPASEGESKVRFQVFDIEHVQSGRRTRVRQLDDAKTWIESISAEGPNRDTK